MSTETNDSLLAKFSETFDAASLPPGITYSVGVIATYPPHDVRMAIQQACRRHEAYQQELQTTGDKGQSPILADALGVLQSEFREQLAEGGVPTANALETVFNPPATLGSAIEAERRKRELLRSQKITSEQALAVQLNTDIMRLSRRSRLWGTVLGLYMGTFSAFGLLQAASQIESPKQSSEQQAETRSDAVEYAFYGSAALAAALGTAGNYGGKRAKGHIARRRARQLIQRRQKQANK